MCRLLMRKFADGTPMDIEKKIITGPDLPAIRTRHKRIAMCSGCYDVMQSGHAVFFGQCKQFAETLVVVVGADEAIARQKPGRPVNPQNNRLYLVAAMQQVDYAILGESLLQPGKIDYAQIMLDLMPDVLVVNDDDSGLEEKRTFCRKLGIALETVPRIVPLFLTPTSSTAIIERQATACAQDPPAGSRTRVLVSGFFDMLHAGHVDFLEEAARLGDLHVSIGSDKNHELLKDTPPLFSELERLRLVRSLSCVRDAFISKGVGPVDFENALNRVKPDIFAINADGHTPDKEAVCRRMAVEYRVLRSIGGRQTSAAATDIAQDPLRVQYRIALAGGWIDQPWISGIRPGAMVVACLEPSLEFARRSGMATSTRDTARRIWGERIPGGNPLKVAKILFGAENPPGTKYIAGSQDAIGLVYPGINRLYYNGQYWPAEITSLIDAQTAAWLEESISLIPITPRPDKYDPLSRQSLQPKWVQVLGEAGEECWQAIRTRDVVMLGRSLNNTLEAWRHLLPNTVPDPILQQLSQYDACCGRSLTGCGGGYIMVADHCRVEGALRIKIKND